MSGQADIILQLAELESLTPADLRKRFQEVYQKPPPKYLSRGLLCHAIAFELQRDTIGHPNEALLIRLKKLAKRLRETGDIGSAPSPPVKPGTRLIREWQGKTHEVLVTERDFVYRDERYRSLSQIARLITGARWSGPRFFGLTAKAGKKLRLTND